MGGIQFQLSPIINMESTGLRNLYSFTSSKMITAEEKDLSFSEHLCG